MTQPTETPASSAETIAQLLALIAAQAAVRDQLAATAARAISLAFAAITSWWDTDQTTAAISRSIRTVQASQRRMAQVTDAYLSRSTSLLTGTRINPVGAVDITALRRQLPQDVIEALARARQSDTGQGPELANSAKRIIATAAQRAQATAVPAETVYGRLADNYRYLVSSGRSTPEKALAAVLHRGAVMADTDIALADRAQTSAFFTMRKPDGVRGYRRVLHPELGSGNPPCGLCVVAADQVYSFEELMPLHGRCRCTVSPVGSEEDPGLQINRDDLQRIYAAAGGTGSKGLKTVRVEVTEHGELGPVLTNADWRFRGPREFARTQSNDAEIRTFAQVEALEADLEALINRHLAGDDTVSDAIDWHERKISQLAARLPIAS